MSSASIEGQEKGSSVSDVEIVDLSVAFAEGMPKYPADWFPTFVIEEVRPTGARWTRRFTNLRLFAHNGTHVESSDHVTGDGVTIDTIPLERFVGVPTVVDLRDVEDGVEVSVEQVRARLSDDEPGRIVLLMTGYDDRRWGTEDFWWRSPWLSQEASEYIASTRPSLIGLDFQTEKPRERDFVNHRALVSTGATLCEYLFNLDRLDESSLFLALPIKIDGVEAAPVRAVGIKWPQVRPR